MEPLDCFSDEPYCRWKCVQSVANGCSLTFIGGEMEYSYMLLDIKV